MLLVLNTDQKANLDNVIGEKINKYIIRKIIEH